MEKYPLDVTSPGPDQRPGYVKSQRLPSDVGLETTIALDGVNVTIIQLDEDHGFILRTDEPMTVNPVNSKQLNIRTQWP